MEDRAVFEDTMLPHRTVLFQSARAMLRNTPEAEEAVQETYLQAWRSLRRFEPGTNARAWLFGILLNVIRRHRRKWLSRFQLVDDPGTLENTVQAAAPQTELLEDRAILDALAAIPQHHSEIVLLCDVEEFSYREVANTLGIPIGTVMSRLSRGRALLREKLAKPAANIGIRKAASMLSPEQERTAPRQAGS